MSKKLSDMKKSTIALCRFLIVILVIGVAACKKDGDELSTAELLIGTWTTSEISIESHVGSQTVIDYLINVVGLSPTVAATQNGLFESALASEVTGSLTLNSDNTYASSFGGGSDSGTWSLSSDDRTLTLFEGADLIIITINSISGTQLKVTLGDNILQDLDSNPGTPDVLVTVEAELTLTK
jgi:hypothetical protein